MKKVALISVAKIIIFLISKLFLIFFSFFTVTGTEQLTGE